MPVDTISIGDYVELIASTFQEAGDPIRAEGQMRYMRDKFPYFGLKAPEWVAILKDIFARHGLYEGEELKAFVRACFEQEYREMHYAGLQMLEKRMRKLEKGDIEFLKECALTNSWWDTVDWVRKFVGVHLLRFPEMQRDVALTWIEDENIWLQRLAIIHQLTYKDKTNWPLMQEVILRRQDSSEFFVQKGMGWALRHYSRTDANAVIGFIEAHPELPALTKREGLKWLKKNNML